MFDGHAAGTLLFLLFTETRVELHHFLAGENDECVDTDLGFFAEPLWLNSGSEGVALLKSKSRLELLLSLIGCIGELPIDLKREDSFRDSGDRGIGAGDICENL